MCKGYKKRNTLIISMLGIIILSLFFSIIFDFMHSWDNYKYKEELRQMIKSQSHDVNCTRYNWKPVEGCECVGDGLCAEGNECIYDSYVLDEFICVDNECFIHNKCTNFSI